MIWPKKPHKWTKEQLDQLKTLRAEGKGASFIATAMNLPKGVVETKIRYLENPSRIQRSVSVRPCMSCQNPFRSKGNHNRLCETCKKKTFSPYAP